MKMSGYHGVVLLLGAVFGIGFAAYHYLSTRSQTHDHCGSGSGGNYEYVYQHQPSEGADSHPNELNRRRRSRSRSRKRDEDVCSICLEDIQATNVKRKLPCNHVFHPLCVAKWIEHSGNVCPNCRLHF